MTTLLDLDAQVQGELRRVHGGTGSAFGYGHERLLVPFVNDSNAGSLPRGTLITRTASDPKLHKTTTTGETIVGVVAGRYSTTTGEFEDADCAESETAAVCVAGRVNVLVSAAATRGQYLRASSTAGQAVGSDLLVVGTFGYVLHAVSSTVVQALLWGGAAAPTQDYTINVLIAGGGSVPPTGVVGQISVDAPGTITSARMLATPSGSAVVDVKKSTYAGFPASLASICSATKPTLSGAQKSEDTTLTGWTTAIAAGDILQFNLDSIATITSVTLALKIRRS